MPAIKSAQKNQFGYLSCKKKYFLMKNVFLLVFAIFSLCIFTQASCQTTPDKVNTGESSKNVSPSPEDIERFIANGWVRYSDFGAKGDGKAEDIEAIAATHAFANQHNLTVKADDGATYYIGGKKRTVTIQTNTEFGNAAFIIDDTNVEDRNAHVFSVNSVKQSFKPLNVTSLKKNQDNLGRSLPGTCLITVTDSNVKRYIRYGPNQNSGSSQTDVFIVDKNGNLDKNTPILWDFDLCLQTYFL